MSECRVCHEIFSGVTVCPTCGTPLKKFGKKIETVEAELQELKTKKKTNRDMSMADKRRLLGMLIFQEGQYGWHFGRKAHLYREICGCWPNKVDQVAAIRPEGELMNLIKYATIKSAMRYKKAKQAEKVGIKMPHSV